MRFGFARLIATFGFVVVGYHTSANLGLRAERGIQARLARGP